MIISQKSFHHNNLILQLIFDKPLNLYYINIHRQNDNSDHDIFGMFLNLESANKKFESIKL